MTNEGWRTWVRGQLADHGWRNVDAANASGLLPSVISGWVHQGRNPSPEALRTFAKACGVPAVAAMLAAGHLTEEDLSELGVEQPSIHEGEVIRRAKRLVNEVFRRIERMSAEHARDDEVAEKLRQVDALDEARREHITRLHSQAEADTGAAEHAELMRRATEETSYENLGLPVDKEKPSRGRA